MPKKKHTQVTAKKDGPPLLPNRDLYHRLNYTLQASAFLQNLAGPSRARNNVGGGIGDDRARDSVNAEDGEAEELRMVATESMRGSKWMIAHNQLKVDPSFKWASCRTCGTVVVPGLTSRVRNRPNPSHSNVAHTTCLTCSSIRTVPVPPVTSPAASTINEEREERSETRLDGPVRSRRRSQIAAKRTVQFHERDPIHSLYAAETKVERWGIHQKPPSSEG